MAYPESLTMDEFVFEFDEFFSMIDTAYTKSVDNKDGKTNPDEIIILFDEVVSEYRKTGFVPKLTGEDENRLYWIVYSGVYDDPRPLLKRKPVKKFSDHQTSPSMFGNQTFPFMFGHQASPFMFER